MTSYAFVESFDFVRERLNGEIDEETSPVDDIQDTTSMHMLFKFDAGWTHNVGVFDPGVANAWNNLKA